ncbi:keratin, type I cytoskeletal 19-like [Bufo gargarizans]|uniref:keratin, type I cytoskeletal 19-like n=1 Tax=Bufo gargarizans TaxID=30331 RepID=UPI001CF26D83|nr:keratin, type I cytoskeletal 19-like [Bufo gargarizans]
MTQNINQVKSGSSQGIRQASTQNVPVHQTTSSSSHHGASHQVRHRGHFRAPSVHGGSGGSGISISRHFTQGWNSGISNFYTNGNHHGNHGAHNMLRYDGLLCFNEKETMQLLNNRLASYMEKVCSLEQENSQLERNIRQWYEKNQSDGLPDCGNYFSTIQNLQKQLPAAYVENAKVFLDMDNAKMAAADLRNKFELDMSLRKNIESDINGLRRVLESLNTETCDLQMTVNSLQEELQELKKNHEEEVNCLRTQLGARVNVEVNAAPCVDLNSVLSEIRKQYEHLMERNLREVEEIFLARSEELNREMISGAEQLQSVSGDLLELKRNMQTLEIELQSQLSMKFALEESLIETESTYGSQLAQLQGLINNVESELAQIRFDLEQQNIAYKQLMDQKNHLEMEIATYKHLLEGHEMQHVKITKANLQRSSNDHTSSPDQVLNETSEASIATSKFLHSQELLRTHLFEGHFKKLLKPMAPSQIPFILKVI